MALDTDLNIDPYYDDYDENKNFHRVLFRPAVPVQARELTQLQDILQNQIERFGQNIYREGSVIRGCSFTYDDKYYYVKVRDLLVDGDPADVGAYVNTYLIHDSSNLHSIVVNSVTGLESQDPDLNTLYIKYLNTGASEKKLFANNDVLTSYDRDYKLVSINVDAGGSGYDNSHLVSITGGSGSGATANLVTYSNGSIRSIVLTSSGNGYITAPAVAITNTSGGSSGIGSGASFTARNYYAKVTVANNLFTSPVGRGYASKVTDGIIFQKGHFVRVDPQEIIVSKYTDTPDGLVLGFVVNEAIVNNNVDETLLDGAQGYSNYTAPGAHRLKLTANLVAISNTAAKSNNEFFSIVEFENGRVTRQRTQTEFNSVSKELARRTKDQSGDFSVVPFVVSTDDFVGTGNSTVNAASHINATVQSGLGYFNGYRVEVKDTLRLPLRKSTDTITNINQDVSVNFGSYVVVNQVLGNFGFDTAVTVDLYNTASDGISVRYGQVPANAGAIIGTAKLRSFVYDTGNVGTPDCRYRMYLFDVKMQAGYSFSQVRSIFRSGYGSADIVLEPARGITSFTRSFNANTSVSSSSDSLSFFDSPAYFSEGDYVLYTVAAGNTEVSGLENGKSYYINSVNSTSITLRTSALGTSAVNLTASSTVEEGHYLSGQKGPKEAILKDSTFDSLVYPSGTFAVANVSSAAFELRGVVPTTFSTAGVGRIDANTTVAYGTGHVFPYGVGTILNSIQELDFIVIPSANTVAGANLAGSVSSYGTGNVITGSSTSFLSQVYVGDYLYFTSSGGSNTTYRRVTRIDSDTTLYIDGTASPAIASANLVIAFPKNVPITLQNRTGSYIEIDGTNQYQANVNLGISLSGSMVANVVCNIKSTTPTLTAKTLTANVYVKIDGAAISSNPKGPWCLGIPDVYKIKAVYKGTGTSYNSSGTNYANNFILDDGQKEAYYGLAYLKANPRNILSLTGTDNLTVVLDVFELATPGKFASTESYPIDDTSSVLPSNKIRTENMKLFRKKDGTVLSLRDCIDLRPYVGNTATRATVLANANTSSEISKDESFTGTKYFPVPNSLFEADIKSYLRRIDTICVDATGTFELVEGEPGNNPTAPRIPDTSTRLSNIFVAEYPTLSAKTASATANGQYASLVEDFQTKRYTMRDIKDIEGRIKQLEYISLLNTLEKKSSTLTVKSEVDPTLNRFKNGFFADGFNDYSLCDTLDPELNIQIEPTASIARPRVLETRIDLKFNSSSSENVTKTNENVLLSYTDTAFIDQPQATKFVNLAQDTWHYRGNLYLVPEFDNYYNIEQNYVTMNVGDGAGLKAIENAFNGLVKAGFEGGLFNTKKTLKVGDYQIKSSTQDVGAAVIKSRTAGTDTWTQETETTFNYQYPKLNGSIQEDTQTVGNFLSDFSLRTFIREQDIYFQAVGLRPGARHYVFVENKDMTSYVTPMKLNNNGAVTGDPIVLDDAGNPTNLTIAGAQGDPLVPIGQTGNDNNGVLYGKLRIGSTAESTFFTGQIQIRVVDVDDINSADAGTSEASSRFNGYAFQGARSLVQLKSTSYQPETLTERGAYTVTDYRTFTTPNGCIPVAQTFRIDEQDAAGVYLTKIDLFFKRKDTSFGVNVQVRETNNGVPTRNIIAVTNVRPSQVNVSDDASLATTVSFREPLYLPAGFEYCIVLHPEGFSPEYLVWTAAAGGRNVRPKVTGQPYREVVVNDWGTGSLFYSTNGSAWTPIQNEDLTMKIYTARFNSSSGKAVFNNGDLEFLTVTSQEGDFTTNERVAQVSNTYLTGTIATSTTINSNNNYTITGTGTSFSSDITPGDFALIVYANTIVDTTGTVSVTGGSNTVTGSGTLFSSELVQGQWVMIANTYIRRVSGITNNTSLTLDSSLAGSVSGQKLVEMSVGYDVSKVVSRASQTSLEVDRIPTQIAQGTSVFANMQKVVSGVIQSQPRLPANTIIVNFSNAANSTFKFTAGSTIVGDESLSSAVINSVIDKDIHFFVPQIQYLTPTKTNVTLYANIARVSSAGSNNYYLIGDVSKMEYEGVIKSKSNEISGTTLTKSLTITIPMGSTSDVPVVSPRVSTKSIIIAGENIVNNDDTDENTRYGNAVTKYISKRIDLKEGQDSEDLQVYLTAHKPSGSTIKVYAKIKNGGDVANFEENSWSELILTNDDYTASPLNEDDMYEYVYTFQQTPGSTSIEGAVSTYSNTRVDGTSAVYTYNFNSDSAVSNTNDTISISSANTKFNVNEPVYYLVQAGNTAVSGLTSNTLYYVQAANSTTIKLTDKIGGSAINLISAASGETGHSISGVDELAPRDLVKIVKSSTLTDFEIGVVSSVAANGTQITLATNNNVTGTGLTLEKVTDRSAAFKYYLNNGVVRYYDANLAVNNGYKQFSIKVVLLSDSGLNVPILEDVRAIALSV